MYTSFCCCFDLAVRRVMFKASLPCLMAGCLCVHSLKFTYFTLKVGWASESDERVGCALGPRELFHSPQWLHLLVQYTAAATVWCSGSPALLGRRISSSLNICKPSFSCSPVCECCPTAPGKWAQGIISALLWAEGRRGASGCKGARSRSSLCKSPR